MTTVVVIGGTGLIGSKVGARLAEHGHEAIAASPKSGVTTLTGEGLAEVLAGAGRRRCIQPEAGLPPAHVGVAAGPVVVQGGDFFGRTVNLAARIAAHASA